MKTEINFTEEELLYIEKLADINASSAESLIRKNIEQFTMCKAMEEEGLCDLLMKNVLEVGKAQLITDSIRKKIEGLRK
jgi:hypothetical protein